MMELIKLDDEFAICKIKDLTAINFNDTFVFVSQTEDEISLVCGEKSIPQNVIAVEKGWRALKIVGTLDFGMVGVIAGISNLLAKAGISIFVISTFNTDYILIKSDKATETVGLLRQNGYSVK